jgi:hypothetical protein
MVDLFSSVALNSMHPIKHKRDDGSAPTLLVLAPDPKAVTPEWLKEKE